MIEIRENDITVAEYLEIRKRVGWRELKPMQAKMAIENSLYVLGAYENGELIGMGRIVGDGAVICYVQDLIVVPQGQRKGVGSMVLDKLISYVDSLRMENSTMMLCLMCAKGREGFYKKHGFIPRPTDDLGPGMIQYLKD